ncbi:Uncharacterized protein OS=Tolypothrix bouteillei VB521301 GN=DA73_43500 PE=4 SV=1 [Gemmata massiliana]|uniref:Membrane-associated oxidoreductase n=1 Tax=Gemmata massiliana TaxID=1210884 RepID=A0A6P2DIH4_9BACT|nr:hypothetical protein [Gemmata massiliana]VTS01708.1 Uncharacterized protein OS=Tolypothrix bouteillei VB521301 GN=DA73_43500 PE=4 SV=1 [Gemmata massiliana]
MSESPTNLVSVPAPENVLPGESLREAIQNRVPTAALIDRFGGQTFVGNVDLTGLEYPYRLVLHNCVFRGQFKADGARFGNTLELTNCKFEEGVALDGAEVEGELTLKLVQAGPIPGEMSENQPVAISLRQVRVQRNLSLEQARVTGAVVLAEAHFDSQVIINGIATTQDLNFQGCEVGGSLMCRSLNSSEPRPEIGGMVWMLGAKVSGSADFSGAKIAGDLNLQNCEVGTELMCRSLNSSAPRPEIGGMVWMSGAKVSGSANFSGAKIAGDLNLQGCEVGTELLCRSLNSSAPQPEIGGEVGMRGAKGSGAADFNGGKIARDLNLQNCEVGGSLMCRSLNSSAPQPEIGGKVWMLGAKVSGSADFSGAKIAGDLNLQNCEVGTELLCRSLNSSAPRPEIGGMVWMSGAKVSGSANFNGAKIAGDLNLQGCEVGGSLTCRSRSSSEPQPEIGGMVWMSGAKVSGSANFSGAKITRSLDLLNAAIGGSFLADRSKPFAPRTTIGAFVRFDGARVEGVTSFVGAEIKGVFRAVRAEFDDGLFLSAGSGSAEISSEYSGGQATAIDVETRPVTCGLNLSHSQVNARLVISGLESSGPVNLHGLRIEGDLEAQSTKLHPTALGPVIANNMKVSGSVDFTDVHINPTPIGIGFDLSFAEIQGDCRLPCIEGGTASIILYHANLGEVRFAGSNLPEITADGMTFRRLILPGDDFIAFLDRTIPFQKSNYRVMEKHLRDLGRDQDADLVYREMLRRDRRGELGRMLFWIDMALFVWPFETRARAGRLRSEKDKQLQVQEQLAPLVAEGTTRSARIRRRTGQAGTKCLDFFSWLGTVFLDVTTGHGTRSHRLRAYLLIVFFVLTWLFYTDPLSVKRATTPTTGDVSAALTAYPNEPDKALDRVDVKLHPKTDDWGFWEASFTAFRVTFPMLKIVTGKDWEPSDERVKWWPLSWMKYETLAGIISSLSYIAVPLFLVSVSGLLKRRGE